MDSTSPKNHTLKSIVLDVRAGLVAVKDAKDAKQHGYLVSLLRQDSITLAEQCWERHVWLDAEDQRLTAERDALFEDELKEQDDKWILAFRQYRTAMDLLGEVLEVLSMPFADTSAPATAVVDAVHAQEALL